MEDDDVLVEASKGHFAALNGLKAAIRGQYHGRPTQRLAAEIALTLLASGTYTPWDIINVQSSLRELSARLERVKA